MILFLSCFDLAAVAVTHPLLILSTVFMIDANVLYRSRNRTGEDEYSVHRFLIVCAVNSIERFLALTCPFFSSDRDYQTTTYNFFS